MGRVEIKGECLVGQGPSVIEHRPRKAEHEVTTDLYTVVMGRTDKSCDPFQVHRSTQCREDRTVKGLDAQRDRVTTCLCHGSEEALVQIIRMESVGARPVDVQSPLPKGITYADHMAPVLGESIILHLEFTVTA